MSIYSVCYGPLETNAFLIGDSEEAAVVDPSFGSSAALLQKARVLGVKIKKILLTHSHWDHIADVHFLKSETKAELYVHALDAGNVERPGSDGLPLFFPIQPAVPDHLLRGGEEIRVGTLSFQVIHTPGHSPGGVCYYYKEKGILLSGDTLFRGTMGSIQLPTADPSQMWKSLETLSKLPPETRVLPGHGAETTIGQEQWLFRRHDEQHWKESAGHSGASGR